MDGQKRVGRRALNGGDGEIARVLRKNFFLELSCDIRKLGARGRSIGLFAKSLILASWKVYLGVL